MRVPCRCHSRARCLMAAKTPLASMRCIGSLKWMREFHKNFQRLLSIMSAGISVKLLLTSQPGSTSPPMSGLTVLTSSKTSDLSRAASLGATPTPSGLRYRHRSSWRPWGAISCDSMFPSMTAYPLRLASVHRGNESQGACMLWMETGMRHRNISISSDTLGQTRCFLV